MSKANLTKMIRGIAMDPEEREFWKAIEANPTEWTNYLVFADWLQDRDDPRAGGLRMIAQCQIIADYTPDDLDRGAAIWDVRFYKGYKFPRVMIDQCSSAMIPHLWYELIDRPSKSDERCMIFSTLTGCIDGMLRGWTKIHPNLQSDLLKLRAK